MATQKSSATRQIKHNHNLSLSDAYTDHPILWLNPSIYNAQHQEYSSIQHAMRAYHKEKQLIIGSYERQLQRLLSQFSVALKQIDYLEAFRTQHNKQIHLSQGHPSRIEHLNKKIRIMHEEMVNIKNLYIKKMDFLSQQKSIQINDLQAEVARLSASHKDFDEEDRKHKEEEEHSMHWKGDRRSVIVDDLNMSKLRQMEAKYKALQEEIERLKLDEEEDEDAIDDSEIVKELKKQLKTAQFQQKLLLKKTKDEAFLKAKKKIMMKQQRQMAEEEFKLQLEEVQINKDLVINRLAAEYHEMADKREEEQLQVEDLKVQIDNLHQTHESQMSALKDEYVSRIHYHRKQIQEYVNAMLSKSREMNVLNNLYDGDGSPGAHVYHEAHTTDESMMNASPHSHTDSLMSQVSQSADEIVTSLVMGIDDELENLFTPHPSAATAINTGHVGRGYSMIEEVSGIANTIEHHPRNTITYLDYSITPRETSVFQNMTFIDPDMTSDDAAADDDDEDEPEPEPQQPQNTSVKPFVPVIRSNASILFSKPPMMNLISAEMSEAVTMRMKSSTHEEVAQQCIEYEDTLTRYESEIGELRDTVDKMLMSHADQESEIKTLKDKNRKAKRKEFDWVTKEREYKSLLAQYRELRENNAKLTLTYFTLQCEYDKLKRDYDEKSGMIMNYGDYQINLANQINIIDDTEEAEDPDDHVPVMLLGAMSSNSPVNTTNAVDDELDLLSNRSDEDDEVDMVVGFMHRGSLAEDEPVPVEGTKLMYLNSSGSAAGSTTHNKQQMSTMSNSHGYNMSYWGNNVAFQYSAKSKDELIGDILKLREKLSEMTDTKFSILQSTKQEIDRLTSKVKMFEEKEIHLDNIQEIQLDQQIGHKTEHKQRKSFDGVNIGMMSNEEHTYTVSRGNDLDSVAKQLASKQHQRAQSHASMASSRNYLSPTATTMQRLGPAIFDENQEDDEEELVVEQEEDDADNTGHVKSLTFLHNITESDEIKME
eukprot:550571_1